MGEHEVRGGGDVVNRGARQARRRLGRIGDQRDDVAVIGIERRLVIGGAKDLDLRQRIALEALDQDKVDGLQQPQKLSQRAAPALRAIRA